MANPKRSTGKANHPAKGASASMVYDRLKIEILEMRLAPGAVLEEAEISNRLNVSRSPVREAVIRLVSEGLVESIRNRGALVARFDFDALPAYFDALKIAYRLNSRLAAEKGGDQPANALQAEEVRHRAAREEKEALGIIRENRAFHDLLAEIGGNKWFRGWQSALLDQGQRIMGLYLHNDGKLEEVYYHRAIIDAVRSRDVDAADAAAAKDAEIVHRAVNNFMGTSRLGNMSHL